MAGSFQYGAFDSASFDALSPAGRLTVGRSYPASYGASYAASYGATVAAPHSEAAPRIVLSSTSVNETASIGDLVGNLSVVNLGALTVSSYAITADPDSKFVLDLVDDTLLELEATVDYSTATSHSVTIEATLSDASTVTRTFNIDVLDTAAPTLSSSVPADNATGVAINASPALTFSENVFFNYPGGGTLSIKVVGGATVETFTPTSTTAATGSAGGSASISNAVLTINPNADLDNEVEYAIRIAADCLEDDAGNAYAGIANDTTLSFTTVTDATPESLILDSLQTETDGMVLNFETGNYLVRTSSVDATGTNASLLTYTSPSTKWIRTVAGLLESGTSIRVDHDGSNNPLGVLVEDARTNYVLYSDDLTNAAWTASNMTTAATSTGPDGASNSATRLTATAGNATVLQAVTHFSAERITSCYIKRITGTGNIDITQDNGSTWTTVTTTGSWTRVNCPAATLANPTVGIRIVTSGDAVDVAFFMNELGAFTSSPIRTTSGSVTRNADQISLATSSFPFSATAGYVLVEAYGKAEDVYHWTLSDGTVNERIYSQFRDFSHLVVVDGGAGQAAIDAGEHTASVFSRTACTWAANDFAASIDGGAAATDGAGTLPTVTTLHIGSNNGGNNLHGYIKFLKYVPRRVSNADIATETA